MPTPQWFVDNEDLIEKHFVYSYWLECDLNEKIRTLTSCDGFAYFDFLKRAATFYGPTEDDLPNGFGVNYSLEES